MTPRQNNDDKDDEEASFDADAARRQLNLLFPEEEETLNPKVTVQGLIQAVQKDEIDLSKFPAPPLTASDRDRRQAEIELLQQLKTKDDPATRLLWNLWFSERGATAKRLLEQADNLMGDPNQWKESERILTQLIAEHGPYFCEPVNRLATLYYLQGRHTDSYALCRVVLSTKPWHFGALSGIVLVATAANEKEKARYWAEQRLPSVAANQSVAPFAAGDGSSHNPRRAAWVERNVQRAREALRDAKRRTRQSLGEPEEYYQEGDGSSSNNSPPDSSAWQ